MTRDQAKNALMLYREGIDDPADAEFAEALALARTDPELGRWLTKQSAVHAAIRQKLRNIEPPPELKNLILEGRTRTKQWWQSGVIWAAAAAIAIFAAVFSFREHPKHSFMAYRTRMARTAMGNYPMPLMTNNLAAIRSYVSTNSIHGDLVLTPQLSKLPGVGCALTRWHNRPVALVCLTGGKEKEVYLFVINQADLSDPPPAEKTQQEIRKIGNLATASWSDKGKTYILATKGGEQFLRSLL